MFSIGTRASSTDETLLAGVLLSAFNRYLGGTDLFLLPRSRSELESILWVALLVRLCLMISHSSRRRYSYDAIHNGLPSLGRPWKRGYSRVSGTCSFSTFWLTFSSGCHLLKNLSKVSSIRDNVETLLASIAVQLKQTWPTCLGLKIIRSNWLFLFCPVTRRLVVFLAALLFCFVFVSSHL